MDAFEVLGEQIAQEMGYTEVVGAGFDLSFAGQAISELVQRGAGELQKREDQAATAKKVKRAVEADAALAKAEAEVESAGKDEARLAAARAVADIAAAEADAAAVDLDDGGRKKRAEVARVALKKAADDALRDPAAAARLRAWQKVVARAGSPAVTPGAGTALVPYTGGGVSGFLRRVHWGVPVWGWGLGGGAVLLGGALLFLRGRR